MKNRSNITKSYKKKAICMAVLSWFLCFGIAAFLIVYGVCNNFIGSGNVNLQDYIGPILYGYGTTFVIMAVLSIIAKDKIKPVVWMMNVILSAYLFNNGVMYAIFAVWLIDTYVITPLKKRFAIKYSINVEIDKRG